MCSGDFKNLGTGVLGISSPQNPTAILLESGFELTQVESQVAHGVMLDTPGGLAGILPTWALGLSVLSETDKGTCCFRNTALSSRGRPA